MNATPGGSGNTGGGNDAEVVAARAVALFNDGFN
jgi:hypothetical protein